jgi:Xaa-Pro aminopeptidase
MSRHKFFNEVKYMMRLPKHNYFDRIRSMQAKLQKADIDAVIIAADEAEPANVRYFTGYSPVFETTAILIPARGESILLTGPESGSLVEVHSVIANYRKLLEFRESSDPEYPDIEQDTFAGVFSEVSESVKIRKLGIIGANVMTVQVYEGITQALKSIPIVKCDDLLKTMRMIKTADEIALMRKAGEIAQKGFELAIEQIKPGMTEFEAIAKAISGVLSNGAESPGFQVWCVSGSHTNQAIGKSTDRIIQKNEIVQLTMGAMVDGYVSSYGRPFAFGKPAQNEIDLIRMGLESNALTHSLIRAGANAGEVARAVHGNVRKKGFGEFIVYGPGHGTGMMECEYPFIETTSDYEMQAGMTYAVDTFLGGKSYGMRFEDTVAVTQDGEDPFAPLHRELIIL